MATIATSLARTSALLAAASSLALCSCAMVRPVFSTQPPMLSVQSSRITQTAEGRAVVEYVVLAENRNNASIPLSAINYRVSVGGQQVFAGQRDAQCSLAPFGSITFSLPAAVPADIAASEIVIAGSVTYRKPGALNETIYELGVLRPAQALHATLSATP